LIARRSIVTADDANFDDAADKGVEAENNTQVSWANGSALNTASTSLRCIANANVYAVGSDMSTTSSADPIDLDGVGGVVTIADSNLIEGSSGEANAIANTRGADYTNAFTDKGMLFYASGANGTFKITSNSEGVSQRFADGRMIAWTVSTTLDTGTLSPGDFSSELSLPTLPDTFVTVSITSIEAIGRTVIGGGWLSCLCG